MCHKQLRDMQSMFFFSLFLQTLIISKWLKIPVSKDEEGWQYH